MVLGEMSDGRMFTDYRSNCNINEGIKKNYNIKSEIELRKFLQSAQYLEILLGKK